MTLLKPGQTFRLANYVCHRTDRLTAGGYSHPGPPSYSPHSVPVPNRTHLEATAIQVILAGRPVNIIAAYSSPSRPLTGADLASCFGEELPILMASLDCAIHTQRRQICCHNTYYVHVNGHDRTCTVILAKRCMKLPDDVCVVIRNMLEQF